jgi:outer membrane beta-barrel protein
MTVKKSFNTLATLFLAGAFAMPATAFAQDEDSESSSESKPAESQEQAEAAKEREETSSTDEDKLDERNRRLADRIKSVQRKVFLKKQRIELFPYFGLDLNDPFFQHLIVGGSLSYHLVDSLAIEGRGGFVFASLKQNTIRLLRQVAGVLPENPPEFKYHGDLDITWAPFYGKVSLLGEGILHFDTYVTAGGGIFGTDAGTNPAANVGIGQRYFLTRWLVARIELRDYIFVDSRNGRSDLQNLMIIGFSVAGFFPTSFEYEFQ